MAHPKFCGEKVCGWLSNPEIHEFFSLESFPLYGTIVTASKNGLISWENLILRELISWDLIS